jgi:hypothetical protein
MLRAVGIRGIDGVDETPDIARAAMKRLRQDR